MKLEPQAARLQRDLDTLAEIGRDPSGGMTRLALTPEDARARAYVREAMLAQGLSISHDEVGNLIGRRAGKTNLLPCVMTGSHLDSVPRGKREPSSPVKTTRSMGRVPSKPASSSARSASSAPTTPSGPS